MGWRLFFLVASTLIPACSYGTVGHEPLAIEPVAVRLEVFDESGAPIPEAVWTSTSGISAAAGPDGAVTLTVDQPTAGVVEAAGYLPEPLVVDPELGDISMRMWARVGPSGTSRLTMHFGGDTMMGRRYIEPTSGDTAVMTPDDGGASARDIVRHIAPLFAAADLTTVNVETVIGNLAREDAYPGKRFLLQSPPEFTAALTSMGVDVATLGNNHAVDWGPAGIRSTLAALGEEGITAVGAGESAAAAKVPASVEVGGYRVSTLSYTTVTGSVVNDHLPLGDESTPQGLDAGDRWQYEHREFGFGTRGSEAWLEPSRYRAGDVWRWFSVLDDHHQTVAWSSVEAVFPEIQDWVARRGHGGAAPFRSLEMADDVAAARSAGADLVVVQIHGGYQFSDVASAFFRRAATAAAEAGADLVVGHHPHVVQGFELSGDVLIAHSLGNLLFDQDFLATFPSMMLRVVFEGDDILEASVYPLLIDRYEPAFATGEIATEIIREVEADSSGFAPTDKLATGTIARNVDAGGPSPLALTTDGYRAVVSSLGRTSELELPRRSDGTARVPADSLIAVGSLPEDAWVGVDLLRWGGFSDGVADGRSEGGTLWAMDSARQTGVVDDDGPVLRAFATRASGTLVRMVARTPFAAHRLFDAGGTPVDAPARYSLRGRIRVDGPAAPVARLDIYHFDDSDLLADPESVFLGDIEVPLVGDTDDEWVAFDIAVPDGALGRPGANMVLVHVIVPTGGLTDMHLDDLELLEWRSAGEMPAGMWMAADAIRSAADPVTVMIR